jgi:hypothetical protein
MDHVLWNELDIDYVKVTLLQVTHVQMLHGPEFPVFCQLRCSGIAGKTDS